MLQPCHSVRIHIASFNFFHFIYLFIFDNINLSVESTTFAQISETKSIHKIKKIFYFSPLQPYSVNGVIKLGFQAQTNFETINHWSSVRGLDKPQMASGQFKLQHNCNCLKFVNRSRMVGWLVVLGLTAL